MTHRDWLLKELEVWREEGLVSAETREKLIARYAKEPTRLAWGAVIAGAFGALLIGCGVIALFAVNWPQFGHETRAILSMLPILICAAVAMFGARKGIRTSAFWEPLGILWCIAMSAGACLIAQTYQLSGSLPGFVLLVMLLILPVTWVTRSCVMTSLWPILPVIWTYEQISGWHPQASYAWVGFPLMALSIPGYIAFLRGKPGRVRLITGQFLTGLVYSIGGAMLWLGVFERSYPYVTTLMSFWVSGALVLSIGVFSKLPVWPMIGTLVISIAAMTTPFGRVGFFWLLSLGIASATICVGVNRQRLAYANIGALTLGWLVLTKFFMCTTPFLIKGLVLIAAGTILTVMNVVMIRFSKNREVQA